MDTTYNNPDELDRLEADLAYWRVLEQYIPEWRIAGWTFRHSALVYTSDQASLSLTGNQRDAIVRALFKAEGRIK